MKFAVYRKLNISQTRNSEKSIVAVVEAKSLYGALMLYKSMRGLPNAYTPLGRRGEYEADGWLVSVRKATAYEIENFVVIRGPLTLENGDVAPHNLPIIHEGLPQTVARWVKSMGLEWVSKAGMLFGGYYRNAEGACYYPSSL